MENPRNPHRRQQDNTEPEKREFRHFAKFASDGTVAAIVEVAVGAPDPVDGEDSVYVDVTDLWPYDFAAVRMPPGQVKHTERAALKDELTKHAFKRE
jgi:hypothetical protein